MPLCKPCDRSIPDYEWSFLVDCKQSRIDHCLTFKIAGVSNYQRAVWTVEPGEEVKVATENDNVHDSRAVVCKIKRDNEWETIGHVKRDQTIEVRDLLGSFSFGLGTILGVHRWDGPTGIEVALPRKQNHFQNDDKFSATVPNCNCGGQSVVRTVFKNGPNKSRLTHGELSIVLLMLCLS